MSETKTQILEWTDQIVGSGDTARYCYQYADPNNFYSVMPFGYDESVVIIRGTGWYIGNGYQGFYFEAENTGTAAMEVSYRILEVSNDDTLSDGSQPNSLREAD